MANPNVKQGVHYSFRQQMKAFEVWRFYNFEDSSGLERTIAELELGYTRIRAVAGVRGSEAFTCYDIYVKDREDAENYVFYDTIYEWIDYVSLDLEEALYQKLTGYLNGQGLSFETCDFPQKPGIKKK